jgi:hypothetical protein
MLPLHPPSAADAVLYLLPPTLHVDSKPLSTAAFAWQDWSSKLHLDYTTLLKISQKTISLLQGSIEYIVIGNTMHLVETSMTDAGPDT